MAKLIRNSKAVEPDENLYKYLSYGEEIKPIPCYKNYFVTNTGRVFSGKKTIEYETLRGESLFCIVWKELKKRKVSGYWAVNLMSSEGKKETKYIHYLVYISFTTRFFDSKVLKIVHINKNKLDNSVSNLSVVFRKKTDYAAHKNYAYQVKMFSNIDENLIDYSSQTTTPFTKK